MTPILAAIVLLIWVTCYGRCLAQQCGALSSAGLPECESICCHEEEQQNNVPAPVPAPPCGICEFINNGGYLPEAGAKLTPPAIVDAVIPLIPDFPLRLLPVESEIQAVCFLNTGPPAHLLRLEEWRAGRSLPVRGPDARR